MEDIKECKDCMDTICVKCDTNNEWISPECCEAIYCPLCKHTETRCTSCGAICCKSEYNLCTKCDLPYCCYCQDMYCYEDKWGNLCCRM